MRRTGRIGSVPVALAVAGLLVAAGCRTDGGGDAAVVTLPVPAGGTPVSCPSGVALVAVDAKDGGVVWSRCAERMSGIEVLAADERTVLAAEYRPAGGLTLLGLEAATGATRWTTEVEPLNESFEADAFEVDGNQLADGVVVYSVPGETMVGVDAVTGAERWRVPARGTLVVAHGEQVAVAAVPGDSGLPAAQQRDLLTVGVDRASGAVRWERRLGPIAMASVSDGVLVYNQIDEQRRNAPPEGPNAPPEGWRWRTVAVSMDDGTEQWSREQGPFLIVSAGLAGGVGLTPAATGPTVLEGFDVVTGKRRWSWDLEGRWSWSNPPAVVASASSPVVAVATGLPAAASGSDEPGATSTTLPAADAVMTVYDRGDGSVRWRIDGGVRPVATTDAFVLIERSGAVTALDALTGQARWTVPFAHPYGIQARGAGDRVYLSSSAGSGAMNRPPDPSEARAPSGATELSSVTLANGDRVRIVEVATATRELCIVVDAQPPTNTCPPGDYGNVPAPPSGVYYPLGSGAVRFPSGFRAYHVLELPAGHARPVTVRDDAGQVWPSGESSAGQRLLVLDPTLQITQSGVRGEPPLTVHGPDGAVIARSERSIPSTTAPTGPLVPDYVRNLGACYRANGADYQFDTTMTTAALPAAAAAAAAWERCRGLAMPGASAAELVFPTCMAAAGWLAPPAPGLGQPGVPGWWDAAAACGWPESPAGSTVLVSTTIEGGVPVRITEPRGGPTLLCVAVTEGRPRQVCASAAEASVPATSLNATLLRSQALAPSPAPGSPAGSATAWFAVLPAGHPRPVVARRPDGTVWLSAESATSDVVVVIEPAAPPNGPPPPALEFVTPDGSVVARLAGPR